MLDPRTSTETFADPGDAVSGEAALHTAPPAEAPRRSSEHAGTEFPAWIWGTMIAAYAVFFTGMILATGRDGDTRFVLVISIGFALVYFTCARLLLALKPARSASDFSRRLKPLQTWTGTMGMGAVAAQVLTVPLCIAFFGLAILAIRAFVG